MKALNRTALRLKALDPMYQWVNYNAPGDTPFTLEEMNTDATIYLIDELACPETDIDKYLEKHFVRFFEQELEDWCDDQSLWPEDLTFKRFCTWFEFETHSLITDFSKKELLIEELD